MADHLPGRGGPSPATASRTPDDLWRELRANGTVMLEPKRFELRSIAAGIAGVALLISLAGVILVLAGAAEVGLAAFGVTGFGLLIAGTLARISLFSRESQWVVDRRGLTIGGERPMSAIRIPNMKGTPREDVARFLDGAMDLARRGFL